MVTAHGRLNVVAARCLWHDRYPKRTRCGPQPRMQDAIHPLYGLRGGQVTSDPRHYLFALVRLLVDPVIEAQAVAASVSPACF